MIPARQLSCAESWFERSLPVNGHAVRNQSSNVIDSRRISDIPLFSGANDAARRILAARATVRRYAAGDVLFTAGSPSRGLFVILDGRVRVLGASGDRPHVLHEEGPGGTLGEVPLFEGGGYPATAVAAAATECLVVARDAVAAAMRSDPSLAWVFLGRLAARVRTLAARLDRLAARSVTARLAAHLLALQASAGAQAISLGGTQAQLAEELGTVREVVVRSLRALRDGGAIRALGKGRYLVRDAAALRRAASGDGHGLGGSGVHQSRRA